ncbi:hypothetical protein AH06_85 [Erwinia phage AH06]|nr:hypothetical protein AH06_85 [Erwinia phage AH06]
MSKLTKMVNLARLADFVNQNFGTDYHLPFVIEIVRNDLGRGEGHYRVDLHCLATPVSNSSGLVYSIPVALSLIDETDLFNQTAASIVGAGAAIEIVGRVLWYWLVTPSSIKHREEALKVVHQAWDAWTLATSIMDGSKSRELMQRPNFICAGVNINQHVLCQTHKLGAHSAWLKRRTFLKEDTVHIESRWTFSRSSQTEDGGLHEVKHILTYVNPADVAPKQYGAIALEFDFFLRK